MRGKIKISPNIAGQAFYYGIFFLLSGIIHYYFCFYYVPAQPAVTPKLDGPKKVQLGAFATYTLSLLNKNADPLRDLIVEYKLPRQFKYISSTPKGEYKSGSKEQSARVIWNLKEIVSNDKINIGLKLKAIRTGKCENNMQIRSGDSQENKLKPMQITSSTNVFFDKKKLIQVAKLLKAMKKKAEAMKKKAEKAKPKEKAKAKPKPKKEEKAKPKPKPKKEEKAKPKPKPKKAKPKPKPKPKKPIKKVEYRQNIENKLKKKWQGRMDKIKKELLKEKEKKEQLKKDREKLEQRNKLLLQKIIEMNKRLVQQKKADEEREKKKRLLEQKRKELQRKKLRSIQRKERKKYERMVKNVQQKLLQQMKQKYAQKMAKLKNRESEIASLSADVRKIQKKNWDKAKELKEKEKKLVSQEETLMALKRKLLREQQLASHNRSNYQKALKRYKDELARREREIKKNNHSTRRENEKLARKIVEYKKQLQRFRSNSNSQHEREIIKNQWKLLEKVRVNSLQQHRGYIDKFAVSKRGVALPSFGYDTNSFRLNADDIENFHGMKLIAFADTQNYFISVFGKSRYRKRVDFSYVMQHSNLALGAQRVYPEIWRDLRYNSGLYDKKDGRLHLAFILPHKTANYIAWKFFTVCKKHNYNPKHIKECSGRFQRTRHGYWSYIIEKLVFKTGQTVRVRDFEVNW